MERYREISGFATRECTVLFLSVVVLILFNNVLIKQAALVSADATWKVDLIEQTLVELPNREWFAEPEDDCYVTVYRDAGCDDNRFDFITRTSAFYCNRTSSLQQFTAIVQAQLSQGNFTLFSLSNNHTVVSVCACLADPCYVYFGMPRYPWNLAFAPGPCLDPSDYFCFFS